MTAIETDEAQEGISPDLHMLLRLLGTAHSVTELLDAALRDIGVSAASFRLLTELVHAPEPLEPHELRAAAIGPGEDVEPLLETLERDGLVRRTAAATVDGRRMRIVITARGRARQHSAAGQIDTVGVQLWEALAGVDAAAVGRALSALR